MVPSATCKDVKASEGLVLSKEYIAKLDWMLNSADLPLGASLFVILGISITDTMQKGALSPLFFALLLPGAYLFGYRYVLSTNLADVNTKTGAIFHRRSVRVLTVLPYVDIFIHLYVMKNRTATAILASTVLVPVWLSLLVARHWGEAMQLLSFHFILQVPLTDVPHYWAVLTNLLMMDCMLVTAAWVKGQLVYIVRRLVELQNSMHGQLQTYEDSLKESEKLHQEMGKSLLEKEVINAQQELRLRTTTKKLVEAEGWADNMTKIADTAVKLAERVQKSA